MLLRPLILLALAGCSTLRERPFSLPAETEATQLGPDTTTGRRPRIFLADAVDEGALVELAPYLGKQFSFGVPADEGRCARTAVHHLLESRPDAILVVPSRPEMTGVTTSFFANPFAPGLVAMSNANYRTAFVGYAMRAMRARLPFAYNTVTGVVTNIPDNSATHGLLEGDVLTKIDGADALPPKAWPTWTLYARMLAHRPGDVVQLEWVRGGTGKMQGTATLANPKAPHRTSRDSIDTSWMPPVEEFKEDGRIIWRIARTQWDPDDAGWIPEGSATPAQREQSLSTSHSP